MSISNVDSVYLAVFGGESPDTPGLDELVDAAEADGADWDRD